MAIYLLFSATYNHVPLASIIDTKIKENLEKAGSAKNIALWNWTPKQKSLLDADIPFEQQDLRISDLAEREGRAVVLAVNKWDLEPEKQSKIKRIKHAVPENRRLSQKLASVIPEDRP